MGDVDDDLDPGETREVSLRVNSGTITLASTSGLSFTSGGNSQASMTFTGTLTDLNTALHDLIYRGDLNFHGSDTLTVTIDDMGETGIVGASQTAFDNVDITVNAANDAPVISSPTSVSLSEDSAVPITGVSVSDVDVNEGTREVQVTLSVSHGILTLSQTSGLSFDAGSNGSGDMTVSGTLADVNAALSTFTYTPFSNYYDTDSVQISVNDLGNYGAPGPLEDSATIALTITDIIDCKPVYSDAAVEQSTSSAFTDTVGTPQLKKVFSLPESRGLLPDDLTSHEGGGQSSFGHLWSLLFEALFGEDESHRNSARDGVGGTRSGPGIADFGGGAGTGAFP